MSGGKSAAPQLKGSNGSEPNRSLPGGDTQEVGAKQPPPPTGPTELLHVDGQRGSTAVQWDNFQRSIFATLIKKNLFSYDYL